MGQASFFNSRYTRFLHLTLLARPYLEPFKLETLKDHLKTQQKKRKKNGCSSQSGKPRKLLLCVLVVKVVGFENAEISAFSYSSLEYPAPIYRRRRTNLVKISKVTQLATFSQYGPSRILTQHNK